MEGWIGPWQCLNDSARRRRTRDTKEDRGGGAKGVQGPELGSEERDSVGIGRGWLPGAAEIIGVSAARLSGAGVSIPQWLNWKL